MARHSFVIPAAVLFLLVVSACSAGGGGTSGTQDVVYIPARWAVNEASDVQTLEAGADAVFVGKVTAKTGQRLDDLEGALASTGKSPMPVSLFSVSVEQVLSGHLQAGGEVSFEQVGGTAPVSGGKTATFALDGDTLMQAGGRYLFFARRTPVGAYSVAPYGRFPLEGDTLKAPPGWERAGAATQLAGADLQVAARKVQADAQ